MKFESSLHSIIIMKASDSKLFCSKYNKALEYSGLHFLILISFIHNLIRFE